MLTYLRAKISHQEDFTSGCQMFLSVVNLGDLKFNLGFLQPSRHVRIIPPFVRLHSVSSRLLSMVKWYTYTVGKTEVCGGKGAQFSLLP
jgi:hypothetical protein